MRSRDGSKLYRFLSGDRGEQVEESPLPEGPRKMIAIVQRYGWDLLALNLAAFIFSILVVTLPLAIVGMVAVLGQMLRGRHPRTLAFFVEIIRERWAVSLGVGFTLGAVLAFGLYGTWFYLRAEASWAIVLAALCFAATIAVVGIAGYAFQLVAESSLGVKACLESAVRLAIIQLPRTLGVLVLTATLAIVIVLAVVGATWTVVAIPTMAFVAIALPGAWAATAGIDEFVKTATPAVAST